MKISKVINYLILCYIILSTSVHSQSCQSDPESILPELPKFDANYAGCYNYYAVDLGSKEANKKCKILSKIQNFSEPSFSACNDFLQPSRAEWKATIADQCLALSKTIKFQTKSFQNCVEYFSISNVARYSSEKKQKIVSAAMHCQKLDQEIDFSSKSFTRCFSLYGGNKYPPREIDAEQSVKIAAYCTEKVKNYDYSNRKLYDCWDKKRMLNQDRKLTIDNCVAENPDSQ